MDLTDIEYKKLDIKEYILYDFLFMRLQNSQKQSTKVEVKQ